MATSTTPQPDAADPPENPPRAWTLTPGCAENTVQNERKPDPSPTQLQRDIPDRLLHIRRGLYQKETGERLRPRDPRIDGINYNVLPNLDLNG
jgi:hypothetical protein